MSAVKNSIIGMVVGNAMGMPLTNIKRESLMESPVTDIKSENGAWGADAAMSLATLESFSKTKEIDYNDIADKFCQIVEEEKYTNSKTVIGPTIKEALTKFAINPVNALTCGVENTMDNEALARMLPIALYAYLYNLNVDEIFNVVRNATYITHKNEVVVLGSYIYVNYLLFLLKGKDKFASYNMVKLLDYNLYFEQDIIEYYNRFLKTNINHLNSNDLKTDNYVVYTLEESIWTILNTNSYSEAVVGAVNLGGDTDTAGAIVGSIAGLIYGHEDIKPRWLEKIQNIDLVIEIVNNFEKMV